MFIYAFIHLHITNILELFRCLISILRQVFCINFSTRIQISEFLSLARLFICRQTSQGDFRLMSFTAGRFSTPLFSIPFSRFIICVGSIALMIRASLIFLFFQSSSFSRYTTSCHLMEWVLCASKCTKKAFVFFHSLHHFGVGISCSPFFAPSHQCTIFYSLHNQIYRLCSFAASLGSLASGDKLLF